MPIYSTMTTTSSIPSTLLPICDAITYTLRYALGQGQHPTLFTQQTTLAQSRMSAQSHITCTMVSLPPPFNVQLDRADVDFLKKKTEVCIEKQKNLLLSESKKILIFKLLLCWSNLCAKAEEEPGRNLCEPDYKQTARSDCQVYA